MLHISLSFRCEIFPYNFECLIRIIRSDGGLCLFPLQNDLNELGLILPITIVGKPVIEILATESPFMLDTL